MASQVCHIVYAKKYFDGLELAKIKDSSKNSRLSSPAGKIDKDHFILGCAFPDIRRIASIKRRNTHLRFDPLDLNFEGLSSFEAGWKFHLYCDMRREEILNKYNFYSLKHSSGVEGAGAKMLEDEIIYDDYDNWEKIIHYFNNPPAVETGLEITPETFCLWYAVLAKYFEQKPNSKSMRIFISKQPSVINHSDEIINSIDQLRKDKKAVEILGKIKEEII